MISQALRRQHTSISRLHLHQHFSRTLTSTSEEKKATPIPDPFPEKTFTRTALVRTSSPIQSLADAWAILRVVERKYGKIAEASFAKDFDMRDKYQMFCHILFLDHKSMIKIETAGHKFVVPAPIKEDRPGGFGLDDVRHLLDSADVDESFDLPSMVTESKERMIIFRITRAVKDFYTLSAHPPAIPNMKLARDFMLWHGFHKLEPFRVSSPIRESEWFEKPYREQVRMRAAVQWASRTGRLDNSDIIRKLTAHESDKIVSDSSPASASMDSPESSSPTTLDMPISHESTPKSTQSLSALTEFPQPPSQSPPVLTQLPPEPTPKPTIPLPLEPTPKPTIPLPLEPTPKPTIPLPLEPTAEPTISRLGQLTSKQKETLQKQMSRAKQLGVKTKQPAEKKTRKPKMEPKKEEPKLDKSPEKPSRPLTRDIVAKFWKFLGR